jgi:hypothetical protein
VLNAASPKTGLITEVYDNARCFNESKVKATKSGGPVHWRKLVSLSVFRLCTWGPSCTGVSMLIASSSNTTSVSSEKHNRKRLSSSVYVQFDMLRDFMGDLEGRESKGWASLSRL